MRLFTNWSKKEAPKLSNYAGSYFTMDSINGPIEVVFINPLKNLVTVSYGKFLTTRNISKLTHPEKWAKLPKFNWTVVTPENEHSCFDTLAQDNCFLIAIDIETFKENAAIRCIAYTGFFYDSNNEDGSGLHSESYVLPVDSEFNLSVLREWNSKLTAPKVFQNGKYDLAYLARYSAPVLNYLYDTANFFHCWYSELPKDLGFLNSFFVRESTYWKDLSETNDLYEYYRYNALDTWGTGCCFLAMVLEAPKYVFDNYKLEFPTVFPCHLSEMIGIERDMDRLLAARKEQDDIIAKQQARLDKILGMPSGVSFNVKSTPQMKLLLKLLGCGDLKSADEKSLKKVKFRHPLNSRIVDIILDIRSARTLNSNFLTAGKEFPGTNRILTALNPHGTDTSRLASKEHHFWYGVNLQNQPRGKIVKQTYKAFPGFYFAEVDLEQAESRDTAYIAGEETLIHNVEHSPDFHSANASAFFGIPFEELWDLANSKTLNKTIRDLAKRVNHGANYVMTAPTLLDTMGEENVLRAKTLLGLDRFMSFLKVCEHLLEQFHRTYPGLQKVFYRKLCEEVMKTHIIQSRAHHYCDSPDKYDPQNNPAWTRYCFGNPVKNKSDKNAYVAHVPQSLNAQTLNRAWMKVFTTVAMNPKHSNNFYLNAQIHDSILFQYRIGHEYLCDMVKECMEIPVTIRGYDDKVRTFIVPASVKNGIAGKPATYWSETE